MHYLELRIPPVAVMFICALAMVLLSLVVPSNIAIPARREIAGGIMLLGVFIALAGVFAFRHHKTTVNPLTPDKSSSLVSTGIYRVTRNPMYLGFLFMLIGWAVLLSSWISLMLAAVFIGYMNTFQIRPEERALSKTFGFEYDSYCKSVRRWL